MGAAYAAVVLERQLRFEDALVDASWHADLSVPSLTVGTETFTAWLLGSAADEANTWLWGWGNDAFGAQHPAVAPTLPLRELGSRHNVAELSAPMIDLRAVPDPGLGAAEALAVVGAGLLGGHAYYRGKYDGGTAYLLVVTQQGAGAAVNPGELRELLLTAVRAFPADPRLTVETYIAHHRLRARRTESGVVAQLPDGSTFEAVFDQAGRLVDVRP